MNILFLGTGAPDYETKLILDKIGIKMAADGK